MGNYLKLKKPQLVQAKCWFSPDARRLEGDQRGSVQSGRHPQRAGQLREVPAVAAVSAGLQGLLPRDVQLPLRVHRCRGRIQVSPIASTNIVSN